MGSHHPDKGINPVARWNRRVFLSPSRGESERRKDVFSTSPAGHSEPCALSMAAASREAQAVIAPAPAKNLRLVIAFMQMTPSDELGETLPAIRLNVNPGKRVVGFTGPQERQRKGWTSGLPTRS